MGQPSQPQQASTENAQPKDANNEKRSRDRGPNRIREPLNPMTLAHECALLLSSDNIFCKLAWGIDKVINPDRVDIGTKETQLSKVSEKWSHWPSSKVFKEVFGFGYNEMKENAMSGAIPKDFTSVVVESVNGFINRAKPVFKNAGKAGQNILHQIGIIDATILDQYRLSSIDIGVVTATVAYEVAATGKADVVTHIEKDQPIFARDNMGKKLKWTEENLNVGQDAVWRFAEKLGLDIPQTYQAIEVFHNMPPKENCGHYFPLKRAKNIQQTAQGVYAIFTPTIVSLSSEISLMTLRIADTYPLTQLGLEAKKARQQLAVVRAKLNIPNIHGQPFKKYQYRGYLVDTNTIDNQMANWSIQLNQAPKSVDVEKHFFYSQYRLGNTPQCLPSTDIVNQADDMHINIYSPSPNAPFTGILSSLSQRSVPSLRHTRVPYSALFVGVKLFDGNNSDEERAFMGEAFGVYPDVTIMKDKVFALMFPNRKDQQSLNDTERANWQRMTAACDAYDKMVKNEGDRMILKARPL